MLVHIRRESTTKDEEYHRLASGARLKPVLAPAESCLLKQRIREVNIIYSPTISDYDDGLILI